MTRAPGLSDFRTDLAASKPCCSSHTPYAMVHRLGSTRAAARARKSAGTGCDGGRWRWSTGSPRDQRVPSSRFMHRCLVYVWTELREPLDGPGNRFSHALATSARWRERCIETRLCTSREASPRLYELQRLARGPLRLGQGVRHVTATPSWPRRHGPKSADIALVPGSAFARASRRRRPRVELRTRFPSSAASWASCIRLLAPKPAFFEPTASRTRPVAAAPTAIDYRTPTPRASPDARGLPCGYLTAPWRPRGAPSSLPRAGSDWCSDLTKLARRNSSDALRAPQRACELISRPFAAAMAWIPAVLLRARPGHVATTTTRKGRRSMRSRASGIGSKVVDLRVIAHGSKVLREFGHVRRHRGCERAPW